MSNDSGVFVGDALVCKLPKETVKKKKLACYGCGKQYGYGKFCSVCGNLITEKTYELEVDVDINNLVEEDTFY